MAGVDPGLPREMVPLRAVGESTLGSGVRQPRRQPARGRRRARTVRPDELRYRADEATIVLIDPRRKSVGVVPEEWLSRYTYALGDIKQGVSSLCELLEKRLPPPTDTQHEMLTRKFWAGREISIVIDDATVWSGYSVLGRVGPLPPILVLDGRRDNGPIVSGVFAEPQRPGKAIYATASGTEGVLIGWTPPPSVPVPQSSS
jgi:S-DNA-T family DNA segregation ATPase FtsK/SpoIIIE